MEGKTIAVQEGTTGDKLATEEIKDSTVKRFKKAVDAAVDLKNGKVDAVVLDALPAQRIVEKNRELMILGEELTKEEYAIAVKKGNKELLDQINATLKRIKEDGTFDSIANAFGMNGGEITLPQSKESEYTEELIMGTNAEFEPFEYRENGEIVGFDIEIAKEIANDMQKKLKVEDMNFDSLLGALSSGKVDMVIAGMTVDPERLESVDFSDPYFNASQVVIIRKTSYIDGSSTSSEVSE